MGVKNCHNVTDTIFRHFKQGDRKTYLESLAYMQKNHFHFYLENCEKLYKRLYVCRSIDGKMANAVPVEELSQNLEKQLKKVLKEIIHDKYKCDIQLHRFRIFRDNDTKKYNITTEEKIENYYKKTHNITVGRPLYLFEMLDDKACTNALLDAANTPCF